MDNLSCELKGNADGVAHRRPVAGESHVDNTQTGARLDDDVLENCSCLIDLKLKADARGA